MERDTHDYTLDWASAARSNETTGMDRPQVVTRHGREAPTKEEARRTPQENWQQMQAAYRPTPREPQVLGAPGRISQKNPRNVTLLGSFSAREAVVLDQKFRVLTAAFNLTRLKMLEFCLVPRKHSEIVRHFKMNPASFKFHENELRSQGLLRKNGVNRGARYRTTKTGKLVLEGIEGIIRKSLSKH